MRKVHSRKYPVELERLLYQVSFPYELYGDPQRLYEYLSGSTPTETLKRALALLKEHLEENE